MELAGMDSTFWLGFVLNNIIGVIIWSVPLIAGIIMVKRGGQRPERLFFAGSALMIMDQVISAVRKIHVQVVMFAVARAGQ